MSRTRKIVISLSALLTIALAALFFHRTATAEPEYQGIPLSRWMVKYHFADYGTAQHTNAIVALRALGPATLQLALQASENPDDPELLARLEAHVKTEQYGRGFKRTLNSLTDRLYGISPSPAASLPILSGTGFVANWYSVKGLGLSAETFLTAFSHLFKGTNQAAKNQALFLMTAAADPEKLEPYFSQAVDSSDSTMLRLLALRIGSARIRSPRLAEHLVASLDRVPAARIDILWALAFMESTASNVLPRLSAHMQAARDSDERYLFASAICSIEPDHAEAMRILLNGLSQPKLRAYAVFSVRPIYPTPFEIPESVYQELSASGPEVLSSKNLDGVEPLAAALMLIELSTSCVRNLFESDNKNARIEAARYFLSLNPNHSQAADVLVELITQPHDQALALAAMDALTTSGAFATSAIRPLQKARAPLSPELRKKFDAWLDNIRTFEIE